MVYVPDMSTTMLAVIFVGAVAWMGIVVMLVHCVSIGQCVWLSPIRKPGPKPDEEAALEVSTERTPLLSRRPSSISIASTRSSVTHAWNSSLPHFSTFNTHHSATRLGLPFKPNSDLEVVDHIVILDTCEDCSPCPTTPNSSRLYISSNTKYIGMPGLCYVKDKEWETALRWVKNGGKYVPVRFWSWDDREMKARLGLAEDGSIEALGLEDVLKAIGKGESRA